MCVLRSGFGGEASGLDVHTHTRAHRVMHTGSHRPGVHLVSLEKNFFTVCNWDSHGSEHIGCQGLQYDP